MIIMVVCISLALEFGIYFTAVRCISVGVRLEETTFKESSVGRFKWFPFAIEI